MFCMRIVILVPHVSVLLVNEDKLYLFIVYRIVSYLCAVNLRMGCYDFG
jgi:hypothetical protein